MVMGDKNRVGDIHDFGRRLIETEDLDPVYSCLWRARLPEPQLCRWLIAYILFYHVGSASWLSEHEGEAFWDACDVAAVNGDPAPIGGRWPRSAERRHFRGAKCVWAVARLRNLSNGYPENLWRNLSGLVTEKVVIQHVSEMWPMCGPWAGFKAADLAERVSGYPIKFSPDTGLLYDSPREALDQLLMDHVDRGGGPMTTRLIYDYMTLWISNFLAPPGRDRVCGPQELETVLCKWGSARGGHYHIGKDIAEVRHALTQWALVSDTAILLYKNAPAMA